MPLGRVKEAAHQVASHDPAESELVDETLPPALGGRMRATMRDLPPHFPSMSAELWGYLQQR